MKNEKIISKIFIFSFFIFHFSLSDAQIINTIAGGGTHGRGDGGPATDAQFCFPSSVAVDKSGNIYISDNCDDKIRIVSVSSGIINSFAGNGSDNYSGDGGPATAAEIGEPMGIAFDTLDNLYITDNFYNVIRKVDKVTGIITTVAGNGYQSFSGSGGWFSGDGGQATDAELNRPQGVCLDKAGNIYIADYYNNRIRKVTISTGVITTVAGNGYGWWHGPGTFTGAYLGDGGPATAAELYGPEGVVVDDSNNIIVSDGWNSAVRKVNATDGIIATIAGNGISGDSGDGGPATAAEIYSPEVSLDTFGNLYITSGSILRMVTKTTGIINTVVGNGISGFTGDGGPATDAELYGIEGVVLDDSGNIYLADAGNYRIRKVTKSISTAVELQKQGNQIAVFPNPSNGTFTLSLSNSNEKCNIEIYNVMGEKVYSNSYQPLANSHQLKTIDLSSQPNGVYFYRVVSINGEVIGEGKVIVQK